MNDGVEVFMSLFGGRTDAYGTWEGGSVKADVAYSAFARHLYGQELIGIYPLTDNSTVMWGCTDIDVDEIDLALNLKTAFEIKGIQSFVEKTRRGYHVWVFADDWIPAPIMRRAFLAAHEAVKVPAKEVNPKQEEATGLGNYVRLPYPNGINEMPENRYVLSEATLEPISLKEFLTEAKQTRTSINLLRPLAELHKPRKRATLDVTSVRMDVQEALDYVSPYVATVWRNGPVGDLDRSNILCMMVHKMREYGTPINHAYTVLVDADKRWGKFHNRPDATEQLVKIVEDIYGIDTTGAFRP
jgi:hypothetical protein